MPRLTKRTVEAIHPVAGKPTYVWDDQLPGFGAKVLPNGGRRYIVKYRFGAGGRRAPQRWMTLGRHGTITCEQARDLAQQVLAAVARGDDPQGQRVAARNAPTLNDLWERYETEQLPLKKPSTAKDYRQRWEDIVAPALGRIFVADVARSDIERLHKKLSHTPYQANRLLAQLSRLMNLAEAWGLRNAGSNPCRFVERFKEEPRERYLNAAELLRLGAALDELVTEKEIWPEAAAAIKLLLLTGARLNERLTAEWTWIDFERRIISLPDSKTGKKQLFLSEAALQVLAQLKASSRDSESVYVLPGRSKGKSLNNLAKPWKRVCARAGLEGVRLHDLRHTAASVAVGRGGSLPIIGRLLGHRQPQTTQRYAHVDVDPALAIANAIGASIGPALRLPPHANGADRDSARADPLPRDPKPR